MRFQAWHIIVLVIVILLVFGSAKLPDIASSIGKSLKVFKKEITELKEDVDTSGMPPSTGTTAGTTTSTPTSGPVTGGAPTYPANPTDVNPDGTPRT